MDERNSFLEEIKFDGDTSVENKNTITVEVSRDEIEGINKELNRINEIIDYIFKRPHAPIENPYYNEKDPNSHISRMNGSRNDVTVSNNYLEYLMSNSNDGSFNMDSEIIKKLLYDIEILNTRVRDFHSSLDEKHAEKQNDLLYDTLPNLEHTIESVKQKTDKLLERSLEEEKRKNEERMENNPPENQLPNNVIEY